MPDEEWTKTTFRLPKSLLKEVKRYALDHDTNDTAIFNEALRRYLESQNISVKLARKIPQK